LDSARKQAQSVRSFYVDLRGLVIVDDSRRGSERRDGVEALAHVANRPIAHHVLDALQSAGVSDVVVAASAAVAREIRTCLAGRQNGGSGMRIRYVGQAAQLDVGEALRLAAPLVGNAPCIAHLASGLLGESLTPLVDRVQIDTPGITLMVHQGPASDEHLSPATQDMLHIAELDSERAALGMAGVWLFGPGALQHVGGAPWRSGTEVDLTTVAERIGAAGGSFQFRLVENWRRYTGDPLELLELNQIALDRLELDQRRPSNHGNRIEGRVQIDEGASVRASVIVGPTVIGPGARIADAYIGPYTAIGAGARVEGAEIERSIIAAGASVMHIGGRLVASVVGRDARIFRDFSLPRALRLRVGDGTEVALC
jgi:glucose-1-phosphate thymidylyltransferase